VGIGAREDRSPHVPDDSWKEAAADQDMWRGMLRRATLAIEEEHKQEYQRAHDRRCWAATSDEFQCSIRKRKCRSRAGHESLSEKRLKLIMDSQRRLRRTAKYKYMYISTDDGKINTNIYAKPAFFFAFVFVCLFSGYVLSRFSRKQPQQCNNKKLVNESTHSSF